MDKSNIYKISEINDSLTQIQFKGKIIKVEEKGQKKSKRLIAHFKDSSGTIELIWFKSIRWIKQNLSLDKEYIVFGKPSFFANKPSMVHPELDVIDENSDDFKGLHGVYSSTEKLINKGLRKEVETGANGTQQYVIKKGTNKGKVAKGFSGNNGSTN